MVCHIQSLPVTLRISKPDVCFLLIGIHVAVVAECLWHIFPRSFKRGSKNNWFLVAFVLVMFVTGTVNFACNTRMTQLMFINNRAFPEGGPMGWFIANYAIDTNTAGNAGYIVANFFADALLVSRLL